MLRLKLSDRPPQHAALLAYYRGTTIDPETNLGLSDVSWEWSANRTGFEDAVKVHRFGTPHDPVGSADVVIGNVSARRRNLIDPVPLPWGNRIGEELRFRNEFLIYNPLVDQFDPDPMGPDEGELAVAELKRGIKVLDIDGTEATDVVWDIGLVPDTGIPDDGRVALGNNVFGWRVFLFIDRETTTDRPLMIRYNAIENVPVIGEPTVLYGHEELLRPAPYLNGVVVEPNTAVPGQDDYALELETDGLRMVWGGVVNPCMALALWSDVPDRGWTVEASGLDRDLIIWNSNTSTELGRVSNIEQYSIREIAQTINRLGLDVSATPLINYPSGELQFSSTITPITRIGSDPVLMESHFFAYYRNESRIYVEKPVDLERHEDWFSNVVASPVRELVSGGPLDGYELTYTIGEHSWQPFSTAFTDHLEAIDEPVGYITGRYISFRHRDILPISIRLLLSDHDMTDAIEDYDETAGVIRLNRDVLDADRITARYAYRPGWNTVVDFINFNMSHLHLPDGFRLFFGIYVIPSKTVSPTGLISTFSPNIGYVVATTVDELRVAIDNMVDSSTGLPMAARLIGILQSNSQGEVDRVGVLDPRRHGGGLKDEIKLKDISDRIPEARFFSDIGYWDGEPYAGHGVIVVQAPSRVFGEDQSPVINPPDGDFIETDGRQSGRDIKRRVDRHLTIGMTSLIDNK